MKQLHERLTRQIEDRLVEPNSGLGQAVSYMLKHWSELTLFLRQAGASLDNNVCERALKKVILHRKNAMFYLTDNGARVGDMYRQENRKRTGISRFAKQLGQETGKGQTFLASSGDEPDRTCCQRGVFVGLRCVCRRP